MTGLVGVEDFCHTALCSTYLLHWVLLVKGVFTLSVALCRFVSPATDDNREDCFYFFQSSRATSSNRVFIVRVNRP
jgi:hypothetical protein